MALRWLFEKNGYTREQMPAMRLTNPSERLNGGSIEAYRLSTLGSYAVLMRLGMCVMETSARGECARGGYSKFAEFRL